MAEKRLIDANSLDAELETLMVRFAALGRKKVAEDYNFVRTVLDNAPPTVDAVEVVRCKDCIHYELGGCLKIYSDGAASKYAWQIRKEDDFCSYGERRTDG